MQVEEIQRVGFVGIERVLKWFFLSRFHLSHLVYIELVICDVGSLNGCVWKPIVSLCK